MKKFLMEIKLVGNNRKKNQIQNLFKYYLPQQKVLRKILEKIFITKKFIQCKTPCILKIDVLKIPDNKTIGKIFSKY